MGAGPPREHAIHSGTSTPPPDPVRPPHTPKQTVAAYVLHKPLPSVSSFSRDFLDAVSGQQHATMPHDLQLNLMREVQRARCLLRWDWYDQFLAHIDDARWENLLATYHRARDEAHKSGADLRAVPGLIRRRPASRSPEWPRGTVPDAELRAETPQELCAVLGVCCDWSGLSKAAIASKAGMPMSSLYALTDRNRTTLPQNRNDQLGRLLRAIELPERQIDRVLAEYRKLRDRKRAAEASAKDGRPAGRPRGACGCEQPVIPLEHAVDRMATVVTKALDDHAAPTRRLRSLLFLCGFAMTAFGSAFTVFVATLAMATSSTLLRAGSALTTLLFALPTVTGGYVMATSQPRAQRANSNDVAPRAERLARA